MALMTLNQAAYGELEDRKSRFTAFLVPIESFETRLEELKVEHRKATHHVTAFRKMLNDGRIEEGAKDDGEPAGTSGTPCLKTLQGAELVDVGVIVVRYFGGTKLGGGGLARAYSGATSRAIDDARARGFILQWRRIVQRRVNASFSQSAALEQRILAAEVNVIERRFTEDGVSILLEGPDEVVAAI